MKPLRLWFLFIVVGLVAMPALSSAQETKGDAPKEKKAKKTEGDDNKLSGTWGSEWGEVNVKVTGDIFAGSWSGGTFKGTFTDEDTLKYIWWEGDKEKENKDCAWWDEPEGMPVKGCEAAAGWGIWDILLTDSTGTGRKLTGTWGFGGSANNGGAWTLHTQKAAKK